MGLTSVHTTVEFFVADEFADMNALGIIGVAHGRATALRTLMTTARAQNVANTIAANGVVQLFNLVGLHFAAHEWLACATAATRDGDFFLARLAWPVVTLIFAVVTAALEQFAADFLARLHWVQARCACRSF